MPPKICLVSTVHPALDVRIFYKEATSLCAAGYETVIIAQHDKDENLAGVKIISLRKPRHRLARVICHTWQAFTKARAEIADAYHVHDPELLPMGLLLKAVTSARVVYDAHEDVHDDILAKDWIPRSLRQAVAWVFDRFEKVACRYFDAVIVATEAIAEKFSPLPTRVIHNYPDLKMFSYPASQATDSEKTIVYVGGISEARGACAMVRAMEYLDDHMVCLAMIGKFMSPDIHERLQGLGGYKKVNYLGWQPPAEIYKFLRSATAGIVCLHPTHAYLTALPVKLFEYMAAGLPVVASNFTLWRQIVEDNRCGICVDPLDPQAIAQAIAYLLSHPEEARKMGENGRRAVEEKYNWDNERLRLLAIYDELIGPPFCARSTATGET